MTKKPISRTAHLYSFMWVLFMLAYVLYQIFNWGLERPFFNALINLAVTIIAILVTAVTGLGDGETVQRLLLSIDESFVLPRLIAHSIVGVASNVSILSLVLWVIYGAIQKVLGTTTALFIGGLVGTLVVLAIIIFSARKN
ncbi:MAG: hypothetical protein ACOZAO_03945 [Patescibacteria group bacterium]